MLFDIAPSEMLLTVVIAVVVIGPKDLPMALRTAGRWLAKMRRVSGHFRNGIETMIREAELEEMEKKWREQNEAIMQAHPPAATPVAPALIEHAPFGDETAGPPHMLALSEYAPHDDSMPDFAGKNGDMMGGHGYLPGDRLPDDRVVGNDPFCDDEPQLPLLSANANANADAGTRAAPAPPTD